MPKGFFDRTAITSNPIESTIPKCGACGLYKTCKSPKMPVTGDGRKSILIVAEAPGQQEDEQNEQLVGKAGQLLRASLLKLGVGLDRDCWKTNSLICRPPDNATPTKDQINYCRPNLTKTIKSLEPRTIILLGNSAIGSLFTPLVRDGMGNEVSKWAGWKIPLQKYNCWVVPTYHPSYVERMKNKKEGPVVRIWFERHLKTAVECEGYPWETIPNYEKDVRVIIDPNEAARKIREFMEKGGAIAFDYETNMLKPDSDLAEIVCCAICWNGQETISYPWVGDAIKATTEIIQSDAKKIGANAKFEDRWTRKILGISVNNWVWDGMLSAHHLDNRRGITSAKFQAFVRLGQASWDSRIKKHLESTNKDGTNNIRRIDLRSLLIYCGIDALVEYKIAKLQRKEMLG